MPPQEPWWEEFMLRILMLPTILSGNRNAQMHSIRKACSSERIKIILGLILYIKDVLGMQYAKKGITGLVL